MTAKCTVISVDGNMATVRAERKSACAECHAQGKACAACDIFLGDDKFECKAYNRINAKVGDEVIVQASSGYVIASAALLFILPLAIAAICYVIALCLKLNEYAPLFAIGGVVVSYAVIFITERSAKKKHDRMIITELVKK